MELFGWVKLGLENWKTIVSIVTLLTTTGVTSCSWLQAREQAQNEKQAAQYLAENMLNVSRETHVIELPKKRQVLQNCTCEKRLKSLESKMQYYHPE